MGLEVFCLWGCGANLMGTYGVVVAVVWDLWGSQGSMGWHLWGNLWGLRCVVLTHGDKSVGIYGAAVLDIWGS